MTQRAIVLLLAMLALLVVQGQPQGEEQWHTAAMRRRERRESRHVGREKSLIFIHVCYLCAAVVLLPSLLHPLSAAPPPPARLDPSVLTRFVDELPRPGIVPPTKPATATKPAFYAITVVETFQQLHRDLSPTRLFAYNGQYPGPTIEAHSNVPIDVEWKNNLPPKHFLPIDPTVFDPNTGPVPLPPTTGPGSCKPKKFKVPPQTRIVTHLHGGHTEAASDGHPNAWFTKDFKKVGPEFKKKVYHYDNSQESATLWYHDHAIGITRLNVYAGLAGFYLLRDERELSTPNLPIDNEFEIPIAFQDRSFNVDGSLFYPDDPIPGVTPPTPSIVPEFFGDHSVVNGKVWPKLTVKPTRYRFRVLDGCNARFLSLRLQSVSGGLSGAVPDVIQIGGDQGFLEAPVTLDQNLLLGPGERADLLIDFSDFAGGSFFVMNDAPTPFMGSIDPTAPNQVPLPVLLRIDVLPEAAIGSTMPVLPALAPPRLDPATAVVTRDQVLLEGQDIFGRLLLLINNRRFDSPTTDFPALGDVEIWRFINTTPDVHPMHIHLVKFFILSRLEIDFAASDPANDRWVTKPPTGMEPVFEGENGWKDVIKSPPGFITSVIAKFDRPGNYVFHCHILGQLKRGKHSADSLAGAEAEEQGTQHETKTARERTCEDEKMHFVVGQVREVDLSIAHLLLSSLLLARSHSLLSRCLPAAAVVAPVHRSLPVLSSPLLTSRLVPLPPVLVRCVAAAVPLPLRRSFAVVLAVVHVLPPDPALRCCC